MFLWLAGFCVVLTTTVCARRWEPPQLQIDENEEPLATPLAIDEDEADTKESPEIDEDFSDFPKGLCQESVVRETCELLSNSRRHVSGVDHVSFYELQSVLKATFDSMANYMEFIGMKHRGAGFRVSCMDLCRLTVQSLPKTHRPPSIDTACFQTGDGIRCDVDVSDETFQNVSFNVLEPDGQEIANFKRQRNHQEVETDGFNPDLSPVDETDEHWIKSDDVEIDQMRISIANLFRIYPPFELEVTDERIPDGDAHGDPPSLLEETIRDSKDDCHHSVPGSVKRERSTWIPDIFLKKKCKCPKGSIVQGKSSRCRSKGYVDDRRKFDPEKLSGKCSCVKEDFSREVIPAKCEDKNPTGFKKRYTGNIPCRKLKSRCHEHKVYDVCPKTCRSTCFLEKKDIVDQKKPWEIKVAKRAVEAQAYTAKALRALGARNANREMRTWFGGSDHITREEVTAVLNGVHRLLSNIDYKYPNKGCGKSTYAYVRPYSPFNKNKRGRYIFYLCDVYMESSKSSQIETLTHEASHHETMYTDDFCTDGTTRNKCDMAYGRSSCKKLARDYPDSAKQNADNFCFFINDVATKKL